MACSIKTNSSGVQQVLAPNGERSLLFDSIMALPFVKDENDALLYHTAMSKYANDSYFTDQNGEPIMVFINSEDNNMLRIPDRVVATESYTAARGSVLSNRNVEVGVVKKSDPLELPAISNRREWFENTRNQAMNTEKQVVSTAATGTKFFVLPSKNDFVSVALTNISSNEVSLVGLQNRLINNEYISTERTSLKEAESLSQETTQSRKQNEKAAILKILQEGQRLPAKPEQTINEYGEITSGKIHLYHSTGGVENLNNILENGIDFTKQKAVEGLFFSKLGSPYRKGDSFVVIETDVENITPDQRYEGQEVAVGQLVDYKIVHASRMSPEQLRTLSVLEDILNRDGVDDYKKSLENYKKYQDNKNIELVKYLEGATRETVVEEDEVQVEVSETKTQNKMSLKIDGVNLSQISVSKAVKREDTDVFTVKRIKLDMPVSPNAYIETFAAATQEMINRAGKNIALTVDVSKLNESARVALQNLTKQGVARQIDESTYEIFEVPPQTVSGKDINLTVNEMIKENKIEARCRI